MSPISAPQWCGHKVGFKVAGLLFVYWHHDPLIWYQLASSCLDGECLWWQHGVSIRWHGIKSDSMGSASDNQATTSFGSHQYSLRIMRSQSSCSSVGFQTESKEEAKPWHTRWTQSAMQEARKAMQEATQCNIASLDVWLRKGKDSGPLLPARYLHIL